MTKFLPQGLKQLIEDKINELTYSKAFFYSVASFYVSYCCIASCILEPLLPLCKNDEGEYELRDFENPAYDQDPCRKRRFFILLWLNIEECNFAQRIIASVLLGGLIGWERRSPDRPAGIRLMALVSLGSCLFSICSAFAFISGPMNWDGSRISAAIPSGVGFLGAGIIFKQADKDEFGDTMHTVHGLTTATSLWLSAAVGIACGGELYFPATFSVAVTLLLLRFGPRTYIPLEEEGQDVVSPIIPNTAYKSLMENMKDPEAIPNEASLFSGASERTRRTNMSRRSNMPNLIA